MLPTASPTPEPPSPTLFPFPDDEEEEEEEPLIRRRAATTSPPSSISLPSTFRLTLHFRKINRPNKTVGRSDLAPTLVWNHSLDTQSFEDFCSAIRDCLDLLLPGRYEWPPDTNPFLKPSHTSAPEIYLEVTEENYREHLETAWWNERILVGNDDVFIHVHLFVDDPPAVPASLVAPVALVSLLPPTGHFDTAVETFQPATQGRVTDAEGMINPHGRLLNEPFQRSYSTLYPGKQQLPPPRQRPVHPSNSTMIPQAFGLDDQLSRIGEKRTVSDDDDGEDYYDEFSGTCSTKVKIEAPMLSLGTDDFVIQNRRVVTRTITSSEGMNLVLHFECLTLNNRAYVSKDASAKSHL
ncbi:hypothetical protein BG015_006385 [Linnemannia schmuckeri]|uniref:Uncharacterized protein n=1 Tax=Linnemannia schmuckeri TaxID=64567 RepID=A0A9P5S245_9FUNG|nr:hypothetical protein BG015_006385 [Linnemannia schmuckeri]